MESGQESDSEDRVLNLNSPVDRRRVLNLVGVGGSLALAGCAGQSGSGNQSGSSGNSSGGSNSSGTNDSSGNSSESGNSNTQQGGHLRVSVTGGHETLNPVLMSVVTEYISTEWMYSNLTQVKPDLTLRPDLATDWEATNDGESWVFMLNEEATFHNGDDVLAEDVKATYDAMYNEEYSSPALDSMGPIENIEVVNDKEVQFNLSNPYGGFPKKTAKVWGRILPKKVLQGPNSDPFTSLATEPQGSGAFKLEEYSPGNQLVFSANEDYWKSSDQGSSLPYVDKITQKIHPEPVTAVNALRNKSVDHYFRPPPNQWSKLTNMSGVETQKIPGGWFYPFIVDVNTEPFGNLKVRKAMKYAVNKNDLISNAAQNLATMAQHTPISPAHEFYADLPNKYGEGANVEKAKQLMEEAGYGDGVQIDSPLLVSPNHGGPMGPTAVLIQENLSKIGIEFEIQRLPWTQFLERNQDTTLAVTSYGIRLNEDGILDILYHSDGAWNYHGWSNQEFDQALEKATKTVDKQKKQELYTKCQKIIQDKGNHIISFFVDRKSARQNYEHNFQMEPTAFRFPAENVWLDSNAPTQQ